MRSHFVHKPLILTMFAALTAAAPARADTLDQALLKKAPEVLKYLKSNGCKTVGVLKFLVHKDGEAKATDSAGTLNLSAARRLEMALILSDENAPGDPSGQVAVIIDASAVAARTAGANHTTPAGRGPLFAADYPLAWGSGSAKPDVLLTGLVRLEKDRHRLRVGVYAYHKGRQADRPTRIGEIVLVSADPNTLAEVGESFGLSRGAFDDDTAQPEAKVKAVAASAERVQAGTDKHPAAAGADAPIALKVFYNDKPQELKFTNGRALIAEPAEGQKVHFVLERRDLSQTTYGVVLKVNGENTLYRQRQPDVSCSKWVMRPGAKPGTIRGFQKADGKAEAFRVLSRAESQGTEVNYGTDVGTITMTVFREKPANAEVRVPNDDEMDESALQRGIFPTARAPTLARLKEMLRGEQIQTKGLLGAGEEIASKTQTVKFEADPSPVLAVTITYYKP